MKKATFVLVLVLAAQSAYAAGTNKILPFATAGANLLTDDQYAIDDDRASGNVPATTARAALVNKALRQCGAMATLLGQFIADHSLDSFSVIDSPLATGVNEIQLEVAIADTVPTATDTAPGKIELATPSETRAGTVTDKVVTPAGLATLTSTEARNGLARVATNADVFAGSDDLKYVTPKKLASRTSTNLRTGIVQLATDAEAIAGTNDTKAVTPHGLHAALGDFASSLTNPGYTTLPNGLIEEWGSSTTTASPAITFPLEFPTAVFSVQVTPDDKTVNVGAASATASGFTLDASAGSHTAYWFAVGH